MSGHRLNREGVPEAFLYARILAGLEDAELPEIRPGAPAIALSKGQVLSGRVMGASPARVILSVGESNPHIDPDRVIALPPDIKELAMIAPEPQPSRRYEIDQRGLPLAEMDEPVPVSLPVTIAICVVATTLFWVGVWAACEMLLRVWPS